MAQQISLRCQCGRVRGMATQLSPSAGTRLICYCDDCQAFAHFLKRADVLDSAGGTDIFQMAPANLRLTQGEDALRSLRLIPKGMIRWYTDCCHTLVGNTINGRVPFVGLVHAFIDPDVDAATRDRVLGEPFARIHGRFAVGGLPANVHATAPVRLALRIVRLGLAWWLGGKGKPSALFDAHNQPRAQPYLLSAEERAALRQPARAN
jgi:hypothetical protein